jgi:4-hydroxy-tetrahydrodipicolinate synthase
MMKEVKQQLRGSICPAIIPFKLSREAYYETMSNLINWQTESESHGVSITGTSGGV